ncbi:PAAR domain-containing protein [Acinetobacter baumannii]|uniref:PAAR domain-containing protein n=1 Tax=Acinetobacter baumannii TaxID=470 RepID=UPI003EDEC922
MATPYITIGCPTSGGGQVISGNNMFLIDGIPVACVGDKATCPTHKVVATIVSGDPCMQIFGKAAARVNDSLSCGCKLLPQQNLVVQDNGGAASSGAKSSSAPISQKQPATDSFVKDEYENYYIEQNTTKYVKFTNGIFPYDEDKKNLFGAISQAVSGVCTFIVTYILKGQELFVTVSMLPPTLSGDATIFPYATLDLVHNNQSLGKTRLEKGKGVWSTENSKEPVGQCKVTLPKPDLSTIEATLTMIYAELSGDFPLGDSRQPTYKSLRPFDLVS